jgi:hypothetical protein
MTFSPLAQESDLISNLESIVDQEYATIKELTDFEKELRFALLRQVELLQLKNEYLNNPYYNAQSQDSKAVNADAQDIIEQLKSAEKN